MRIHAKSQRMRSSKRHLPLRTRADAKDSTNQHNRGETRARSAHKKDSKGVVTAERALHTSVLGNVSHPRKRLVAALLNDLEVADLDARRREVGDLKLHLDGRPSLFLLCKCAKSETCGWQF